MRGLRKVSFVFATALKRRDGSHAGSDIPQDVFIRFHHKAGVGAGDTQPAVDPHPRSGKPLQHQTKTEGIRPHHLTHLDVILGSLAVAPRSSGARAVELLLRFQHLRNGRLEVAGNLF
ncbi:unnamed protein product [Phytomonas sp. EM1]|nr:unnamed protein product [Phytomonas sp. EM1]|eukprot:CCW60616.1 unnamed protein product [Phytomonas sp. isolate EM1]